MIHHLSIGVHDPERVAAVLAEVMGGFFRPFPPNQGSFFVFQKDEHGTMIEVHKAGTVLTPDDHGFGKVELRDPNYGPTHFAMSVDRSVEEIKAIADREHWLCRRNDRAEFPVLEFWIENAFMCEFLPPEFAAEYLRIARRGPPGEPGAPEPRRARAPVDPLFLDRWSPRAFDASEMSEADLATIFEAARWAPSAFNHQPWRFIYARREGPDWDRFVSLLRPFNTAWARNASVLIVIVSDTLIQLPNAPGLAPSHSNSFDAGAAWALLALQATRLGYSTHGMTGIDFDRARTELAVPERFRVEAAVALGRRGDKASLPEPLRAREVPSARKDVAEIVMEGRFGWDSK